MWRKLIHKLFLIKEIVAKNGEIHFRRYRLLSLPWLRIYIHQILVSDYEAHFHDHPWHFCSYILKGTYSEKCTYHKHNHDIEWYHVYLHGDVIVHHAQDSHKIRLVSPEVWTFVITWGRPREWGYRTENGWIGHEEYRKLKNEGKLQ